MSEAADAEDRHQVARPSSAVTQRIECGDARAQQGSGVSGCQIIGNVSQGVRRRDHVFGVTAVISDSWHPQLDAGYKISTAAGIAMAAVSPMPADACALASLPADDIRPHGVDNAGNFVAWDARILNSREQSHHSEGIAVANATCLHFDADFVASRLWNFALYQFQRGIWLTYLHGSHVIAS